MGEFYDKEKFTGGRASSENQASGRSAYGGGAGSGGQPPRRPPQKKQDNSGWYSWPVIIILFCVGAWPIALALLFFNLYGDGRRKSQSGGARQTKSSYAQQAESAVERAMRRAENQVDRAGSRIDRAGERLDQAMRGAEETVDRAVGRAMEEMERTISRAAREVEQAGRGVSSGQGRRQSAPQPKAKPAKPPKEKKKKAKPAGVLLRLLGIIFMAVAGIVGLDFISEIVSGYGADFENFFAATGFGFAGALMFFRGHYLNKMSRRSQRYILAIGNVDAMPIDEIAKRVNRTPAKAAKEMQKLIDKGYLGEDAYIDYERGYFLRFGATLEEEEEPEPAVSREAPAEPTPKEAQEGYSGILRNIRRANDRIADPELSRKIDRLEQISGLIFKEVEEHPEKRNSIHTFFDYYLPTTQKLLDTYADFEETGVEGEHLRQAKERIEQTMDMIVGGFEHQLDQLYSSDAMDVVSDIQVMEAMLKRDTASAARDFGYPEPPKTRPKADGGAQDGGDVQQLQL